MDIDDARIQELIKLGEGVKMRESKMSDIRFRKWMNLDTKFSKVLKLLIETEDVLSDLDDYQLNNDQCYPEIEDFYNKVAFIRKDFTKYIDENKDILLDEDKINKYFNINIK